MDNRESPPVHAVHVGPVCKRCGGPLVGEETYYVYVRQQKLLTSGQAIADTCLSCIGEILLDDPRFVAKLLAKFFNHPGVPDKLAEILLNKIDEVKSKKKPPGA